MNLDLLIFQQINGWAGKSALLDALGVFFASYLQYILAVLLIFLFRKNLRAIFWSLAAVVLARFGAVALIRLFWSRPRPFIAEDVNLLIEKADEPSFPSGHAAFFFALSYVVYSYNKKAGIFFFAASFLITLARVFVGVHWPSDILGGAFVGILCGWLVVKISKNFIVPGEGVEPSRP